MDHAALRFEARLQGASRQVKSRLDGAQAQQDALASRLDILESQWVNSIAISYMALSLAAIAGRALGHSLPALLLCPFMVWAAVSRWTSSRDLTRAWSEANCDLETAQAEGVADLEACRSGAMDDLAELRLHESWLDPAARRVRLLRDLTGERIRSEMAGVKKRMGRRLRTLRSGAMGDPAESRLESRVDPAGSRVQSQRYLTGERISSEVAEVEKRMGRRWEMLQSRLDQRKNLLSEQWWHISLFTLITTGFVVFPGALTPFNICFYMLVCLMPASWWSTREQPSPAHARQARAAWRNL